MSVVVVVDVGDVVVGCVVGVDGVDVSGVGVGVCYWCNQHYKR